MTKEIMKYVFLGLLIVVSAIHLYHSWKDEKLKRPFTKWALLPLITGFFLCSVDSLNTYGWILLAALITSWLGDVLLIPPGMKFFVAGGISFIFTHICLAVLYAMQIQWNAVIWYIVIPVALAYLAVVIKVIKVLSSYASKVMKIPLFAYLCFNGLMNTFALMLLTSQPCIGTALAYAGAILFFASDCSLFFVKLHENKELVFKKHFTVMLTYILGEFLITLGMSMIIGG